MWWLIGQLLRKRRFRDKHRSKLNKVIAIWTICLRAVFIKMSIFETTTLGVLWIIQKKSVWTCTSTNWVLRKTCKKHYFNLRAVSSRAMLSSEGVCFVRIKLIFSKTKHALFIEFLIQLYYIVFQKSILIYFEGRDPFNFFQNTRHLNKK